MENEQTNNVPIQENPQAEDQQPVQETNQEPEWVAPTKEEYGKAIQSASSKAKYELLQELGIKSVDDFKNLSNTYKTAIGERDSLKESNEKYSAQISQMKEEMVLKDLGVSDDFREDFLTLTKARVSSEKDFASAAKEVLERNPNWKVNKEPVRFGTEKHEENKDTNTLSKKFPWIK